MIPSARGGATAGKRVGATIRRAGVFLGAVGIIAAAAVLTTGPALASVGSQPGNLRFDPANGVVTLTPTWSTTDGCPVGYQGSAQVSVFTGGGRFLSSISNVAYGVTKSFKGELEGTVSAILRFAHIHDGESLEFVVGCYSQVGGTGKSVWIQSTDLTLSSDGKSYTTSAPSSQQGSTSGGGSSSSSGQQGSTGHQGSSTAGSPASALAADSSGMGTAGALGIAGGCVLLLALALGVIAYRRRNRSRLM